jgi:hypothetical protein
VQAVTEDDKENNVHIVLRLYGSTERMKMSSHVMSCILRHEADLCISVCVNHHDMKIQGTEYPHARV